MTAAEQEERRRTLLVLPLGKYFLRAHILTSARNPVGYWNGLILALRLGRSGLRSLFFHLIYFAEAVVAGYAAQEEGFRHIHSHFSSTVGLIAAAVFGLDFSVTIHGPDEFRNPEGFGMREKVAGARFISTISHYARSQVMLSADPADWARVEVCRLGVDPSVFQPGPRRKAGEVFRVICVGRLAPVKAQRILIGACAQLVSTGWKLRLHLVGSGPDAARLKQFAESLQMDAHVVFEGPRNQDEVIALYRQSDVFALASFGEGVPVVLMEAMAMELPCVATWVNGVPELIRDREEGLLVAPSDISGVARAIEELLKSPELRLRLGRAGRQRVLKDYDLRKNALELADVFRKYESDAANRTAQSAPRV
jgi:colanic acid/amylovoran biosynthesis glycosyltransferase